MISPIIPKTHAIANIVAFASFVNSPFCQIFMSFSPFNKSNVSLSNNPETDRSAVVLRLGSHFLL